MDQNLYEGGRLTTLYVEGPHQLLQLSCLQLLEDRTESTLFGWTTAPRIQCGQTDDADHFLVKTYPPADSIIRVPAFISDSSVTDNPAGVDGHLQYPYRRK